MGQVMIRCPQTGKLVSTGIAMDKASFESSTLTNNSVKCPLCGNIHVWSKRDATLV